MDSRTSVGLVDVGDDRIPVFKRLACPPCIPVRFGDPSGRLDRVVDVIHPFHLCADPVTQNGQFRCDFVIEIFPFIEIFQSAGTRLDPKVSTDFPYSQIEITIAIGRHDPVHRNPARQHLRKSVNSHERTCPVKLTTQQADKKVIIASFIHSVRRFG